MTDNRLAEKLLDKKERIDDAKVSKNKEEGKLEEVFKHLKKKFDCKSLKAVEKELREREKEIQKGQRALDKGVKALEDNYEW